MRFREKGQGGGGGGGLIGETTYQVSCYFGRASRRSSFLLELFCGEEEEEDEEGVDE